LHGLRPCAPDAMNEHDAIPARPRIRPLMAFPLDGPQGRAVCLRDPQGFSDEVLVVKPVTYFLLSLMDGNRDVGDLQADFLRRTGILLPRDQIREVTRRLGRALFLDDETFRRRRREVEEAFAAASARSAVHAGTAYPADPGELVRFLDGFLEGVEGVAAVDPCGLIAPHIDIRQAGRCYAAAYASLRGSAARRFVILGTAHAPLGGHRFAACTKDFDTPLGPVPADGPALASLVEEVGDWILGGELSHRTEHSVEFQVLFLRHLFADREIRILPLLCGSLADLGAGPAGAAADPEEAALVGWLGEWVRREGAVVIAGADLSHVGPKFGQSRPVERAHLAVLETHDRELLTLVESGDADGFLARIQTEEDAYNVCGVPNIYTLLRVLEGVRGRTVDYGVFLEEATASAVSYSSLVFEDG